MKLKASKILEIQQYLAEFAKTREVIAPVQLRIARILMKIEEDATIINKQIQKLQKDHEAKPIDGGNLLKITKNPEEYQAKVQAILDTELEVPVTDGISMADIETVKLTTAEMCALMPFLTEAQTP